MPAIKNGLLKKLAAAIQFRKKAIAREQARVLDIIQKSGLTKSLDSIHTAVAGLDSASLTRDSSLKALAKAIDELKTAFLKNKPATDNAGGGNGAVLDEPGTLPEMPAGDSDIENLVKQLVPLITNNDAQDAQAEKEKQEKLRTIRKILFHPPAHIDTLQLSDTLQRTFQLKLKNKALIYQAYTSWTPLPYNQTDFRFMDALSYQSIPFNAAGTITSLNGWDTAAIVDVAKANSVKVLLTLVNKEAQSIATFLASAPAQQQFASQVLQLLQQRRADGIVLDMQNLPARYSSRFTAFVGNLWQALAAGNKTYLFIIVIPPHDKTNAFNLPMLSTYADHFMISYAERNEAAAGPLMPLQGAKGNDLKTCLSRYLNTQVEPAKFMVQLPYYGTIYRGAGPNQFNQFAKYITFNEIKNQYQSPPSYDKATSTAYIDLTTTGKAAALPPNPAETIAARVWYDDEKTLAAKYDYLLSTGIGGIAIQSIGYDGCYGEWRDVLADKFVVPDTLFLENITAKAAKAVPATTEEWQWNRAFIQAKSEEYSFLFAYPCETNYPRILVRRWQKAGVQNLDRNQVKAEANRLLCILTWIILLFCVAGVLLFIYQVRRLDKWRWKKWVAGILVFLFSLLTLSTFMYFFVDGNIVGFGTTDHPQDCYDFPFGTLLGFITVGMLVGIALTRYLIFPSIRKDDIP